MRVVVALVFLLLALPASAQSSDESYLNARNTASAELKQMAQMPEYNPTQDLGKPELFTAAFKAEYVRRRRDVEAQLRDVLGPLPALPGFARAGVLTWTETGMGPQGQSGVVAAAPQMWGDVVLARKEAPTSYHLAVAIDDALQGVTDVVRGQDLFWSTAIHRLLQALLGLPEPAYHHHRLILDAGGRKLSKSTLATSLRDLRASGATPADVRRRVGLGR